MTTPSPKNPWSRGFLLAGLGAILVALACTAPGPNNVEDGGTTAEIEVSLPPPAESSEEVSAAPEFTPFTVRPEIKNRQGVIEFLEEEYPVELKTQGVGGTVLVWVFIDESGAVQKSYLEKTSGHEALDQAAIRVAVRTEFSPALDGEKPVSVWAPLPITFATDRGGAAAERGAEFEIPPQPPNSRTPVTGDRYEEIRLPPTPEEIIEGRVGDYEPLPPGYDVESIADAPTFTPYTVRPAIDNRPEVARALEASYPPELRDQGIGGTATVWFLIDETGAIHSAMVDETSGYEALDAAALEVAEIIEFTPAMNRDKAVPVWISLPITFTTR